MTKFRVKNVPFIGSFESGERERVSMSGEYDPGKLYQLVDPKIPYLYYCRECNFCDKSGEHYGLFYLIRKDDPIFDYDYESYTTNWAPIKALVNKSTGYFTCAEKKIQAILQREKCECYEH
jgi:hypothetical protein